ncbi:MAG TPA: type II toxin-antitoxin system RelE/ParE family toxin [Caulobacteraceae bacterium]
MSGYIVAPRARRELYEILDYISERSPAGARRVRSAISGAMERIARTPGMGHKREDITDRPVRFWSVLGRYTLIYREDDPIEFIHVVGPGRDVASILG